MDSDGKNRLFGYFAAEGKKFIAYVRSRFSEIGEMDAEDIVSEVMLRLAVRADISLPTDHLAAYVYRSLNNQTVDHRRKSAHTLSLQSLADEDGEISFLELLMDDGASVSGEAERREFTSRLKEAVDALEPRQRAVFIATEIKGKTFGELSEAWNEPVGTLLSRKCRAVKALREMLREIET
jgi:RNA polymerase sigma factor (sigma-70 family)